MSNEFNPDWTLSPQDQLRVKLTLALSKHIPGWPGATDEQLAAVAADICEDLSRKLEEARGRIGELEHDVTRQMAIANEHANDSITKRIRIAELEAMLGAAIKSHDKVPENIPLPKWVESARAVLEGKDDG